MDKINFFENIELRQLSNIFEKNGKQLFVVGGAVRDFLLGLEPKNVDIDLCSSASIQEVVEMLDGTEFSVAPKNLMLGVVSIVCGEEHFEYAQFRKEEYAKQFSHNPARIEFVDSIEVDSSRRDFTINAIYFDLVKGEFVDFCGGIEDLQNRVIKTVRQPKETLAVDPARIFRMIQFSLRLNFDIDPEVKEVAKVFAKNCRSMSPNRQLVELQKIDNAKDCYHNFTPKNFEQKKTELFSEFGIVVNN